MTISFVILLMGDKNDNPYDFLFDFKKIFAALIRLTVFRKRIFADLNERSIK